MNSTLKLGLILAAIGIVSGLIFNLVIDPAIMFSARNSFIFMGLTLVITAVLGRKMLREPDGDRLGYGEAVKKLFVAMMIGLIISSVAGILLYGNNENMKVLYKENLISTNESTMKWTAEMTGMDDVELEEQLDTMREEVESGEYPGSGYPFSWSMLPLTIGVSTIIYLFLCLLIALFVREKETQYS